MSQIFKASTSSPSPPTVPTSFTTDNGTAIPAANILDVRGIDTSDNNDNGIQTTGGLVQAGAGNRVQVQLTNRITGSLTTTTAVANNQQIFNMGATPAVFTFWGKIIAFNSTSSLGASWDLEATARTDGATGTEIAVEVKNARLEGAMSGCSVTASVLGNSLFITVQGYNTDTLKWNLLVEYRMSS